MLNSLPKSFKVHRRCCTAHVPALKSCPQAQPSCLQLLLCHTAAPCTRTPCGRNLFISLTATPVPPRDRWFSRHCARRLPKWSSDQTLGWGRGIRMGSLACMAADLPFDSWNRKQRSVIIEVHVLVSLHGGLPGGPPLGAQGGGKGLQSPPPPPCPPSSYTISVGLPDIAACLLRAPLDICGVSLCITRFVSVIA